MLNHSTGTLQNIAIFQHLSGWSTRQCRNTWVVPGCKKGMWSLRTWWLHFPADHQRCPTLRPFETSKKKTATTTSKKTCLYTFPPKSDKFPTSNLFFPVLFPLKRPQNFQLRCGPQWGVGGSFGATPWWDSSPSPLAGGSPPWRWRFLAPFGPWPSRSLEGEKGGPIVERCGTCW